jgi:hypothetical protein
VVQVEGGDKRRVQLDDLQSSRTTIAINAKHKPIEERGKSERIKSGAMTTHILKSAQNIST